MTLLLLFHDLLLLSSDVRVWSDFLKPNLHPSSVLELPFWPIADPFDTYGAGKGPDMPWHVPLAIPGTPVMLMSLSVPIRNINQYYPARRPRLLLRHHPVSAVVTKWGCFDICIDCGNVLVFRRYAEECDYLRNITFISDLFDGFGGLTTSLAQEIRDEMPRVTMVSPYPTTC